MAKREPRYNDVPITEIPEVVNFENVKARYHKFKQDNAAYFQYLNQIQEEYNIALQAAEKAVKVNQVSCGDFHYYLKLDKIDDDMAYQIHGHEKFLALGGTIETVTIRKMDKTRYMSNVQAGVVTADERQLTVKTEPRYHKPEGMNVP